MKSSILVIDDDPRICKLIKSYIIKQFQHNVCTASDGQIGLDMINDTDFNLVISDIRMPRLDGIRLLEKVKAKDPYLPVILMTGQSDFDSLFAAMKHGANNYLIKPFELEVMGEAVTRALDFYAVAKNGSSKSEEAKKFIVRKEVDIEFKSEINLISAVSNYGMDVYKNCTQDVKGAQDVYVALQEILMNSLEHGNLELGSEKDESYYEEQKNRLLDPLYSQRSITFKIKYESDHVEFYVKDQGKGFNYRQIENCLDPMNLFKTSGRGIFLATCFMDELEYLDSGNHVRMVKRFHK
jgi:YesN/AraC family two-component response regulator